MSAPTIEIEMEEMGVRRAVPADEAVSVEHNDPPMRSCSLSLFIVFGCFTITLACFLGLILVQLKTGTLEIGPYID
ncbi:ORF8 [Ranid herpesvirus 2]|uniref:ORF8 n=1 Tax=Ranid herpesvirus 2 TaxID=389214 RepID=Q14W98_9VIRU|nr:ORF8 [Ranid herpesvirus 2]ABG25571.1 ORF8 [Ranid herpesvirus 2]